MKPKDCVSRRIKKASMCTPSRHSSGDAWHRLYESAMLELDDTKMLTRIAEARTAILDRAEDILTNSSSQERRAINEGLASFART
jgi:hypothetical protein